MRYHALATDYDGTLAHDGVVAESTIAALHRLRGSGRRLVLVTGRELGDLQGVFPKLALFDRVVAENGALLHDPRSGTDKLLGEPPSAAFVDALRSRKISPLFVGRSIVATVQPHDGTVLEVIRDLGLELQVIFNKGAVMVLATGVNKATGLMSALRDLRLSPHEVVAVGDAENDHALLDLCECGVAVANAVPGLRERADWVTSGARGDGVEQLIARLIASDLADVPLERRAIPVGEVAGDGPLRMPSVTGALLIGGPSGSGKSRLVASFLHRVREAAYQFCVVDPEGDYPSLPRSVVFGSPDREPSIREVIDLLTDPDESAVVNLLGVALEDRPRCFQTLFAELEALRARTGRPHWIAVGEAHAVAPASWKGPRDRRAFENSLLVTPELARLTRAALDAVDQVIAVGPSAPRANAEFAAATGRPEPPVPAETPASGEALFWRPGRPDAPVRFRFETREGPSRRDRRRTTDASVGDERAFSFRGPAGRLNLKAQNVDLFRQLAEGVDDDTWLFHLRRGDYSRWFRTAVRDGALAEAVERIESREDLPADESRREVVAAIENRYPPTRSTSGN